MSHSILSTPHIQDVPRYFVKRGTSEAMSKENTSTSSASDAMPVITAQAIAQLSVDTAGLSINGDLARHPHGLLFRFLSGGGSISLASDKEKLRFMRKKILDKFFVVAITDNHSTVDALVDVIPSFEREDCNVFS
ncbi:hypothetical protein CONPUDRAFT_75812 [Coniophora puteana RWD-64-598 SS2]|uniref:Uncharacterized protein n=1 Tax=Coniophora puteana (strain RWD-64-598) TaxID=741705 RepID=A0A5M3MGG5_CONPW|nr:uncharacterized protein CONPUDRAFT_75812 [Coniophora puteana RWD-64-598 SS2]EIW78086.1 hypothetical protein CONPUDRAFT_75812 [Coniophora puteana RWD-64-598 SS2]